MELSERLTVCLSISVIIAGLVGFILVIRKDKASSLRKKIRATLPGCPPLQLRCVLGLLSKQGQDLQKLIPFLFDVVPKTPLQTISIDVSLGGFLKLISLSGLDKITMVPNSFQLLTDQCGTASQCCYPVPPGGCPASSSLFPSPTMMSSLSSLSSHKITGTSCTGTPCPTTTCSPLTPVTACSALYGCSNTCCGKSIGDTGAILDFYGTCVFMIPSLTLNYQVCIGSSCSPLSTNLTNIYMQLPSVHFALNIDCDNPVVSVKAANLNGFCMCSQGGDTNLCALLNDAIVTYNDLFQQTVGQAVANLFVGMQLPSAVYDALKCACAGKCF